ncbi:MAG: glycerophosphoryl diester phosphodiesterase [Nocardioidaceae bacterium]|nr:glycerophosphoryl diester phosphodiesterase [Nocardioidaceae bacterium]
MRPIVIGHRGASGHRPELTESAFRLAYRLGADSIELDLLPTRDGHLVVRHDLELSRTTDVASHPELAHLRRTVEVDGEVATGWFVHDLTLAELRTLRCRERWPRKRAASATYDGREPVLTFAEVLDVVEGEAARRGRPLAVHAELKHPAFLESVGLFVPDLVEGFERPRLTWMSFDPCVLRRLALRGRTDLVRLFDKTPKPRDVGEAAEYATGIGVRRKAVLGRETGSPTDLVARAHRRGLDVLVWTHRAENAHLPPSLRIGTDEHGHGDGRRAAQMLFEAGIDGLITDFPEIGAAALAEHAVLPVAR